MRELGWATQLLNIWVLFHGMWIAGILFKVFVGLEIGGIRLPAGIVPYVALVVAGVWIYKKKRGARIIATIILVWPTIGIARMIVTRLLGSWPYEYTIANQIFAVGYLVVNGLCFTYLWSRSVGNPYLNSGATEGSASS